MLFSEDWNLCIGGENKYQTNEEMFLLANHKPCQFDIFDTLLDELAFDNFVMVSL